MMKTFSGRVRPWMKVAVPACFLIFTALAVAPRFLKASEPANWESMRRDVSRFERELDEMLIDSPNFLVSGGDNARAVYLPETGLIVTFDATLVGSRFSRGIGRFNFSRHGRDITIFGGDDDDWWDDDEDDDRDSKIEKDAKVEKEDRSSKRKGREERRFTRGKEELVEFLADYGGEIDGLRDDEAIVIVACMDDNRHLKRNGISRVVTRVRVGDLKGSNAQNSVTQEEY